MSNFGAFSERKFRGKNFLDKISRLERRANAQARAENPIDASALEGNVRNWSAESEGEMRAGDLGDGQVLMKADAMEINWWLPLLLADDVITSISIVKLKTIGGTKYLYVGGDFTRIGGVTANNVARYNFDTRSWEALLDDSLTYGQVMCIGFEPGTDTIYVGGNLSLSNDNIWRDDGAGGWEVVNGGLNQDVQCLEWDGSGVLHVGGLFTNAGGVAAADYIVKDDGAGSWTSVNGGLPAGSSVNAMVFDSDETLYIVGFFTNASGVAAADYIAKADGAGAWTSVNGGLNGVPQKIKFHPVTEKLYVSGNFTQDASGVDIADMIVCDDGAGSWAAVCADTLNNTVFDFTWDSEGMLVVVGYFTDASGDAATDGIAQTDGTYWKPLGAGFGKAVGSASVRTIDIDTNNSIYCGGDFETAGTIVVNQIATYTRPLADALDMIAGLFEQYQARATAAYAPIAKGVTNGDSHDHSGGDGAQIDHTGLANIGTNTHAVIDTHLAMKRWTTTVKATGESVNNSSVLQNDDELSVLLEANRAYAIRGRIWFVTLAAADFKYLFTFAGTLLYIKHTSYPAGSATGTTTIDTALPGTTVSVLGTGTAGGYIEFDALCVVDGSNRYFTFAWAQNTATVGNTTVRGGSYLETCPVG